MPDIDEPILFIEDTEMTNRGFLERDLQSYLHSRRSRKIGALIIGRFQKESKISKEALNFYIYNDI